MSASRTTDNNKNRVAELAARLFRRRRPPAATASFGASPMAERCLDCGRACKATRITAMELTTGTAPRFTESLGKADGEPLAQACHCEQLTRLYRDMWNNDDCTDADITVGLAVALPAYRDQLRSDTSHTCVDGELPVLVVPVPGEPHLLSAVFAARALESGDHPVDYRVPLSLDELAMLVSQRHYAGVVLATSTVFSRSRRLDSIARCAKTARGASAHPLHIVLYGRIAEESRCEPIQGIDGVIAATDELASEFETDLPRIH